MTSRRTNMCKELYSCASVRLFTLYFFVSYKNDAKLIEVERYRDIQVFTNSLRRIKQWRRGTPPSFCPCLLASFPPFTFHSPLPPSLPPCIPPSVPLSLPHSLPTSFPLITTVRWHYWRDICILTTFIHIVDVTAAYWRHLDDMQMSRRHIDDV